MTLLTRAGQCMKRPGLGPRSGAQRALKPGRECRSSQGPPECCTPGSRAGGAVFAQSAHFMMASSMASDDTQSCVEWRSFALQGPLTG